MVAGLFNPGPHRIKKLMTVEEFMVEKYRVEKFRVEILGLKCPATNLIIQVFWCWIVASIETFSFGQFCDFTERGIATQNFRRWWKLKCWSKTAHLFSKVIIEWFSPESAKYLLLPSEWKSIDLIKTCSNLFTKIGDESDISHWICNSGEKIFPFIK